MRGFSESAAMAGLVGALAAAIVFGAAAMSAGLGWHDTGVALARVLHVGAAVVWGGFIVFVNVVQLVALAAASDSERPVILRQIVPRTARVFGIAADVTLLTGFALLVPMVAALDARPLLLAGVLGGIAMWGIVRFVLKPSVAIVTGQRVTGDAERTRARQRIAFWARMNLVLLLPVTVAMLLAVHGLG